MDSKVKVYIDGSEGTTGLRIFERFMSRDDVEILKILFLSFERTPRSVRG